MRRVWIVFVATVIAYGCELPRADFAPDVPPQDTASSGVGGHEPEPLETADAEFERLVTTRDEARPDERDRPVSEDERLERRRIVLEARARAEADVAAGEPRIVTYGLTLGDSSDIDPDTGFPIRYLG